MNTTLLIIGALSVVVVFWLINTYNKFVVKNNRVKQTGSTICVMLKQRNDMIPNLVATVQSYIRHEKSTFVEVAELRSQALSANNEQEQDGEALSGKVDDIADLRSQMQQTDNEQTQIRLGAEQSKKLADVKVMVEQYPELKADKQFIRLEASIEEMEYQLQAARRTFNAAAVDFNNYVQMFPSSLIASAKNYQPYELITIPEAEMANVNVKALFKD